MRYQVDNPTVVSETIQDEAIVINLATGSYYSVTGTGAAIWDAVGAGATKDEVVDELERLYDAPRDELADAVDGLLRQLVDERLIVPRNGSKPAERHLSANGSRMPFTAPVFQKYTDMQDIILMDPVHEVSAEGWPHRQAADA
jgi:hypothetical protein